MQARRSIVILGLILGATFLLLAARPLDLGAMLTKLAHARAGFVSAALVCSLAYMGLKALRWHYLVRPLAYIPVRRLLVPVFAGGAGNVLFPHAGELVRAIGVGREHRIAASSLLGSIVIERVFDFLAVLALAVLVLPGVRTEAAQLVAAGYALGAFCAVLIMAALVFVMWTERCLQIVGVFLGPLPESWRAVALDRLREMAGGFASIRRPGLLLPVLALSVLQWLMLALCVVFSMAAVDAPVTYLAAVSVLVLCVAGLTLPSAPAYLGTTQLAFTAGLAAFGVSADSAFSGSVIYNAMVVVPVLIIGLPALRRVWT